MKLSSLLELSSRVPRCGKGSGFCFSLSRLPDAFPDLAVIVILPMELSSRVPRCGKGSGFCFSLSPMGFRLSSRGAATRDLHLLYFPRLPDSPMAFRLSSRGAPTRDLHLLFTFPDCRLPICHPHSPLPLYRSFVQFIRLTVTVYRARYRVRFWEGIGAKDNQEGTTASCRRTSYVYKI
jgi:hypothetical protein